MLIISSSFTCFAASTSYYTNEYITISVDDLVWQTVQDQLTHVVGRQAAIWIRYALEFLF